MMQYENLGEDLSELSSLLGEPVETTKIRAKGSQRPKGKHYRAMLNDDIARDIGKIRRWEIREFGYKY